jgi:hypothetical protein
VKPGTSAALSSGPGLVGTIELGAGDAPLDVVPVAAADEEFVGEFVGECVGEAVAAAPLCPVVGGLSARLLVRSPHPLATARQVATQTRRRTSGRAGIWFLTVLGVQGPA